ncbi:hypothetical protein Dimus_012764 [Dionaea muscipula]
MRSPSIFLLVGSHKLQRDLERRIGDTQRAAEGTGFPWLDRYSRKLILISQPAAVPPIVASPVASRLFLSCKTNIKTLYVNQGRKEMFGVQQKNQRQQNSRAGK